MSELMIDGSTTVIQRPDAPYTLTDAEADEWRAIVASMPPEHFARIHYPMLTQLCRHKVASDRVAQLTEAVCRQKKLDRAELASLQTMQAVESSAIIRLCRSMRLTHQSLYRAESVKPRPVAMIKEPWDPDD
jgi:chaperone required for assembly of F1-ATPase